MALFEDENECVCSYTICVVLAVIFLTIRTGIAAYFAYKYMNRNKKTELKKILVIKQHLVIELTNGRSQRITRQKSNLLLF